METSIYVAQEQRGAGLGKKLYLALEDVLARQNILNLNACIAYTDGEDPYLPPDSLCFHEKMGYRQTAHFHQCGYKLGKWYDIVWMEKFLADHPARPEAVIPVGSL